MMEIKTKVEYTYIAKAFIKRFFFVLPYWLICLFLTCSTIAAVPVLVTPENNFSVSKEVNQPKVLGDYTEIRGADIQDPTKSEPKELSLDNSNISAESYIVADAQNGSVIALKNPTEKRSIASLTKLMTGLVIYTENLLGKNVQIFPEDQLNTSPILGLKEGDFVNSSDLFRSMLIGSANDAANTLANFYTRTTGRNFIERMNDIARILDMKDSSFSNPLGFEKSGNYSTAQDVLKLVLATQKYEEFRSIGDKTFYEFDGNLRKYRIKATNKLIGKHLDVAAVKTGYTEVAKETMVSKITRNGSSIYVIILGSNDREGDTLEIADQVFGIH